MAAGRILVCSVGFSVALLFLVFYTQLILLKSMENDIGSARMPVEAFEFAAWKFFKPSIDQRPLVETIASCRLATATFTALVASLSACCSSVATLLASLELLSQRERSLEVLVSR